MGRPNYNEIKAENTETRRRMRESNGWITAIVVSPIVRKILNGEDVVFKEPQINGISDEEFQDVLFYFRQKSKEFKLSMDSRCFKNHHEGNPCKRCGFMVQQ